MADKGKERDDDDQEDGSIEKKKIQLKISLVGALLTVLAIFSLFQTAAIGYLLMADHEDPRVAENSSSIQLLKADLERIEKVTESAEAYNRRAQILEERMNRLLKKTDLNNFGNVRELILEQEANYQLFIAALQQGMLDLSRMLKGSRTWYDVYKEDLDRVAQASKERYLRMKELIPEGDDSSVEGRRQPVN